jgi:hypothetical protein
VGTREELDVDRDALDRRSARNVVRSADLVRRLDQILRERNAHLVTVDASIRKARAVTDAIEVRGRKPAYQEAASDEPSQVAGISPPA